MSVLYLAFETDERPNRMARLQKSGAHVVVAEPRWPGFFELAKREKPYAIAIDFHEAPSHSLETADYLSKAKETREVALFLLRVPGDRLEAVQKRLPHATVTTEQELSGRLSEMEKEAEARAREKKEAAAAAKKAARAANAAAKAAAAGKPPKPAAPAKPVSKAKPAPGAAKKKPPAKKSAPSSAKKAQPRKKK
jgi:hypothetical protein